LGKTLDLMCGGVDAEQMLCRKEVSQMLEKIIVIRTCHRDDKTGWYFFLVIVNNEVLWSWASEPEEAIRIAKMMIVEEGEPA